MISIKYQFHPVGQGLFSSGCIYAKHHTSDFNWIYDCGTSSNKSVLHNEIDIYISSLTKNKIDMVFLSHFDKDHINGLTYLLNKNIKVKNLILPYLSLQNRIFCAFSSKIYIKNNLFEAFFDPINYFKKLNNDIENFTFILDKKYKHRFSQHKYEFQNNDYPAFDSLTSSKINYYYSFQPILNQSNYEFIPYNDTSFFKQKINSKSNFYRKVVKYKSILLKSNTNVLKNDKILSKIKQEYDAEFGSTSRKRNLISLFLYGGIQNNSSKSKAKNGILYTGDGFLTRKKFLNFQNAITKRRINNLLCFQVMHHGSKSSWFKGLASLINPEISIFCADPVHRYKHPNSCVLNDFKSNYPIIVNNIGIKIYYLL